MGSFCIAQGAQLVVCANLDGWNGEWNGKEVQEGRDICVHIADSLCCRAETNTTFCKMITLPTSEKERELVGFCAL